MAKKITKKKISQREYKKSIISKWKKIGKIYACDISNDLFRSNLIFCYGAIDDFYDFVKTFDGIEFEKDIDPTEAVYFGGKNNKTKEFYNFICVQTNDFTARDYGNLVHELHHFTHMSLDNKGLSYGIGGEELYAYFQGHFTELCVKALIELKKILK